MIALHAAARLACAVLLGPMMAHAVSAQGFPEKPVHVIVPFRPGGGVDVQVRLISQKLYELWGQPAVLDYRPGASGMMGTNLVAKAAPDGYTAGAVSETIPGYSVQSIAGVIVPSGTPRQIVRKMSLDINRVLQSADVIDRMGKIGMEPYGMTPEQFDAFIRSEIEKWKRLVSSAGIRAE